MTYNCKQECCRDFDAEKRAEEEALQQQKGKSEADDDGEDSYANNDNEGEANGDKVSDGFGVDDEWDVEERCKKCKRPTKATRDCNLILHVSILSMKIFIGDANKPWKG